MSLKLLSRIRHELNCKVEQFHSFEDGSLEFQVIFNNDYRVFVEKKTNMYNVIVFHRNPGMIINDIIGSFCCTDSDFFTHLEIISRFN